MENANQIDGYVYIARIIDHGGKFVNGYHKIGLSKQYKVRETQLNSTHLPFDVLMVRVFETTNMKQLESMLHLCFEDYRVVKEYDYRKNITTEWFDVNDIDVFNERIDKFTELMSIYGTKEIDISKSIDNDTTLTQEEKEEVKETVHRAKSSSFVLRIGDKVYDDGSQADLFVKAYTYILNVIGKDNMIKYAKCVKQTKSEFLSYRANLSKIEIETYTGIRELDDMFIFVYHSANSKKRLIDYLCKKFNIDNVSVIVQN
jgi:hypothetical protein